jgi:uncharacterized protein (DUF302 family)
MDAIESVLDRSVADAEHAVRDALATEGFGILTEIDVAATLRARLGIDRPPLKILGACNPALAHRALDVDPSLALLLPCNVVLEDIGNGRTRVAIAHPVALLAAGGCGAEGELEAIGAQAASALARVLDRLAK